MRRGNTLFERVRDDSQGATNIFFVSCRLAKQTITKKLNGHHLIYAGHQ